MLRLEYLQTQKIVPIETSFFPYHYIPDIFWSLHLFLIITSLSIELHYLFQYFRTTLAILQLLLSKQTIALFTIIIGIFCLPDRTIRLDLTNTKLYSLPLLWTPILFTISQYFITTLPIIIEQYFIITINWYPTFH